VSRALRKVLVLGAAALLAASCSAAPGAKKVPVKVRLSCNELYEMMQNMPFDRLHNTNGPVTDVLTSVQKPGCTVAGEGSRSRLSVLERTSATRPDARLRELMPNRGWREEMQYAASGPGHTAFAYDLGGVLCYISARWDGGADESPADNGKDRYEITVSCSEPHH
jgi:hypothetical protein